jgi:hypothetical protein
MMDDMTAYVRFRDIRSFRQDKGTLGLPEGHEHITRAARKEVALLLEIQTRTHAFPRPILVDAHTRLMYCQKYSKNSEWNSTIVLPLLIKCQKLLNATAAGSKELEAAESLLLSSVLSRSGKSHRKIGGESGGGGFNSVLPKTKKRKRITLPSAKNGTRTNSGESTARSSASKRMRPDLVGLGPPDLLTKVAEAMVELGPAMNHQPPLVETQVDSRRVRFVGVEEENV